MLGQDDFKCWIGRHYGYIERVLEGPGAYSELWCPLKLKFISNCDNCERNELEKEMRADPNNYQEWLRRNNMEEYYEVCDDAKFEEVLRSMREQDDYDFENWR